MILPRALRSSGSWDEIDWSDFGTSPGLIELSSCRRLVTCSPNWMNWTIDEASPIALSGSMVVKGSEAAVSNVDVVEAIFPHGLACSRDHRTHQALTHNFAVKVGRPQSICNSRIETNFLAVEEWRCCDSRGGGCVSRLRRLNSALGSSMKPRR